MSKTKRLAVTIGFLSIGFVPMAHAYVDPGTGTLLIQWLFGAAMAAVAVLSVYWQRTKDFLARRFGNTSGRDDPDEPAAGAPGRD